MSETRVIAVAVEGDGGLDARVSEHFGHCSGFVVVQVDDGVITASRTEANPFAEAHQPGQLPQVVKHLGASVLLAGGMGPRAEAILSKFGIEVSTGASGSVRDAVAAFVLGGLRGFTPCSQHGHNDACGEHHHH